MNALNFADSPDTMNAPPLCDDITSVDSIIARVLDIDIDQVRDELRVCEFLSIAVMAAI